MQIELTHREDATVVSLSGNVDLDSTAELCRHLGGCLEDAGTSFIINMRGVHGLSSAAVGALISFTRKVESNGGKVALCHIPANIGRLLVLLRVQGCFRTASCEESALDSLAGRH